MRRNRKILASCPVVVLLGDGRLKGLDTRGAIAVADDAIIILDRFGHLFSYDLKSRCSASYRTSLRSRTNSRNTLSNGCAGSPFCAGQACVHPESDNVQNLSHFQD